METIPSFVVKLASPDWAVAEFAQAPLVDRRLNPRLIDLASAFARQPGAPLPQACESQAQIQGGYRFIENDFVSPQDMLLGHAAATCGRLAAQPLILTPQDTTGLRFNRAGTAGLGSIKAKGATAQSLGLWLHTTQAFTASGLPLGLLQAHVWARDREQRTGRSRDHKPLEDKESFRWLESYEVCQRCLRQLPTPVRWINLADKEGDLYDIFAYVSAQATPRVEALVRSQHNRRLGTGEEKLWEQLARAPLAATLEVPLTRQANRPARLAQVQVRWMQVLLPPPDRRSGPPLRLWAVEARELHAPPGQEPLLWRLLTTVPVTRAEEAVHIVHWYAVRWKIEVFHKILKSVCRAEARQFETRQRLERGLVIDLVVAWRIQVLTEAERQTPELPANQFFAENEWRALYCYFHRSPEVPKQPPTLGQMNAWLGRLGGCVPCKATPYPGPITLARGLLRLVDITAMWEIQNTQPKRCDE